MTDRILKFQDVCKRYGQLQVLDNTSFYVKEGEIVCLLGPSGSGKTTLFKMATGLEEPDRGRIELNQGLTRGYVFQEPRLLPWKTVRENLEFVQRNFLKEQPAIRIRERLLELTGLSGFEDSYPLQLSGGMKQRLEFIRALSIKPQFLFLDEPFKSVDTQTRVNLRQMLLRFQEKLSLSILFITHDPEEAVLMADRLYILSDKPARVIREMTFDRPRSHRSLNDDEIYEAYREIIELFTELVDEYPWPRNEQTADILDQIL